MGAESENWGSCSGLPTCASCVSSRNGTRLLHPRAYQRARELASYLVRSNATVHASSDLKLPTEGSTGLDRTTALVGELQHQRQCRGPPSTHVYTGSTKGDYTCAMLMAY